jgi:CHASE2 domain-containing sensor protein
MQLPPFLSRAVALLRRISRPVARKGWWHWIRFGLLLAAGAYVGNLLSDSPSFTNIRFKMYQFQTRMQRGGPTYPQHTVLVLLNDEDFWGPRFESREPLKRDQLAALLDKLNQAGAETVALDLDFFSPIPDKPDYEYPGFLAEDQVLKAAIKRMCDAGRYVVLATDAEPVAGWGAGTGPQEEKPSIYTPWLPELPCVRTGYTDSPDDLRKIAGVKVLQDGRGLDSFALAMVKIGDPTAYANIVNSEDKGFRFGQFLTPADYSPKNGRQFVFNGEAVFNMSPNDLRQAVAEREVIIGTHWHWLAKGIGSIGDMHDTPGGDEPGAMVLANYVEAIRNETGTFTAISDRTAEVLEWAMTCGLAVLFVLEIRVVWKWAGFLLTCLLSLLLTYVLLQNLGLFLDFFIPILIIVVHTIAEELLEMRRELKHATHALKELKR